MIKHTYIQTSIRTYVRHTSIHTYKLQRMQKHHCRKPSPSMWLQSPSWARVKTYGTPKLEGRLMNIMYPERTYLGKGGICWVHIVWGGFVLIWGLDSSLITFGHYEIVITHSVKIIVNGNDVIIYIYIYNYVYIYDYVPISPWFHKVFSYAEPPFPAPSLDGKPGGSHEPRGARSEGTARGIPWIT